MRILKVVFCLTIILLNTFCSSSIKHTDTPDKNEVMDQLIKVNDYWQSTHTNPGNAFWDNAAYHTGNMAAYDVSQKQEYLNYSINWAVQNEWKGAKSDNKENWKYATYSEGHEHVLFGDWQICFQTYIDIFNLTEPKDSTKINRALEVMNYQINKDNIDYWWWADALYMVMPVMTKLYKMTNDEIYLDKLYEYFSYSKDLMFDEETGIFFRDAKYIYPKHKTSSGKKDFWARGNGWVFAGLAKVLSDMPESYKHREWFENVFINMAVYLKTIQQPEGYWTRSLLDPEQSPGYETSGTAFFTFGYIWGINNKLLNKQDYWPVVAKSWKYLSEIAVDEQGRVGYVQPIGERAIPGQVVDANSTSNFGVGAYLLAASEMINHISLSDQQCTH